MKKKSETALLIALGGIIGALITLLFTTDKGENIRYTITSEFDIFKEKVKSFLK